MSAERSTSRARTFWVGTCSCSSRPAAAALRPKAPPPSGRRGEGEEEWEDEAFLAARPSLFPCLRGPRETQSWAAALAARGAGAALQTSSSSRTLRAPRPSTGGAAPQTTSTARGGHNAGPAYQPRFLEAARGTGTKSRGEDLTNTRRNCALRLGSLPTLAPLTDQCIRNRDN